MDAIEIKNLNKTYRNGITALEDISFSVAEGDFFALLGPNGAGKSTTINILTSLTRKTKGRIKIFGVDIEKDFSLAKSFMGIVPQEFNCNVFAKIEQILIDQAGFYGLPKNIAKPRIEHYLKKLHLWDKRDQTPRELSGGMKRRLMIARALIHEPKLLILDEPTAGVDVELRHDMWEFLTELNNNGVTIILTTHYLEEAEHLCRNIAIISNGTIIQKGNMKNFLQSVTSETFQLDLNEELQQAPSIPGFVTRLTDGYTIEIEVKHDQALSTVFTELAKQNLNVTSMRNKTNRLENLFLSLTQKEESA